jgi:NADH:ubiquinone oxidoreductase subunit E
MDTENILSIIRNGNGKAGLISILEDIQAKYTYLPEKALRIVAKETGHSLVDIFGVATFYKAFSLKPRGKHCVSACLGTACHVRGAQTIVEEFKRELEINPGDTTPDGEISLETVNCLGACALGPIVVLVEHYFANVTPEKIKDIVRSAKNGAHGSNGNGNGHVFPIEASCPQCKHSLTDNDYYLHGYPSIRATVSAGNKRGWVRLSSLYGDFAMTNEHEVPPDTVVNFFCPHCGSSLNGTSTCINCHAPMASMNVNGGGGVIRICTRTGCNGHMLDVNGAAFQ